jgi:hypothetical protein
VGETARENADITPRANCLHNVYFIPDPYLAQKTIVVFVASLINSQLVVLMLRLLQPRAHTTFHLAHTVPQHFLPTRVLSFKFIIVTIESGSFDFGISCLYGNNFEMVRCLHLLDVLRQ